MKKFFILGVFALATLAFTSCDPNKEQCWKMTIVSDAGTVIYYYYGNGVDSDAQLELLASSHPGFKATKVQTFLSKENCHK